MSAERSDKKVDTFAPSKLGEYKVINEIAEGTFGKVKSTSGSFFLLRLQLSFILYIAFV